MATIKSYTDIIEEKAKAYDEAIAKAKEVYQRGYYISGDIESIFPKLKESEDEKIRKELIKFVKVNIPDEERYIAWLEKQGQVSKKVSIWKHWNNGIAGNGEGKQIYLIKIGNTYNLSSCLSFECDYIELSELDNLMLEKQGEQKPLKEHDVCDTCDEKSSCVIPCPIKLVEQKPAWSEEDEKILKEITTDVRFEGYNNDLQADSYRKIRWLKSLKDRVQPKVEWSEEDESRMNNLCHFLEEYGNQYYGHLTLQDTISWLKSLRPHNWTKEDKEIYKLPSKIKYR